jgi:hypothetical protein
LKLVRIGEYSDPYGELSRNESLSSAEVRAGESSCIFFDFSAIPVPSCLAGSLFTALVLLHTSTLPY